MEVTVQRAYIEDSPTTWGAVETNELVQIDTYEDGVAVTTQRLKLMRPRVTLEAGFYVNVLDYRHLKHLQHANQDYLRQVDFERERSRY